jgi:hypothetical protein
VLIAPISNPRPLSFLGVTHDPNLFRIMAGTTGFEPATSAVTVLHSDIFHHLQTRGERLRPPKSCKTALFVDWIVDQELTEKWWETNCPRPTDRILVTGSSRA